MSNILKKECRAMAKTPSGGAVIKREKYSWAEPLAEGRFEKVNKLRLNIDGDYQRDEVTAAKTLLIAREWDWKLFGTISVIERKDGTLWVYDGGHRTRASFLRDDICELPCMVFLVEDKQSEAKAFIGANTLKSSVSAYHKHRAALLTKDPVALAAQAIIDKNGYTLSKSKPGKWQFVAIKALHSIVKDDEELANKAFSACVCIAEDGEPFSGHILAGMYTCQKKLNGKTDIFSGRNLAKLKGETLPGIERAIRREKHLSGSCGVLVSASGVLAVINKGKHRHIKFSL